MNVIDATADFERWLRKQIPLVRQDLALKHAHMAEAPFPFMRATFYRWLQRWHEVCPDLVKAPSVLAVGDLHIENFGTWRDQEGRLIWGVNDLDEAWPAPYTLDLLRLTTSAYLAIWAEHLSLTRREADCRARQPGAPPHPGGLVLARSVHCAGGQGDSHFGVGLVQRCLFR